jgi:hypothetical protein
MLIVGYVFAIRSERRLCAEVQVNLLRRRSQVLFRQHRSNASVELFWHVAFTPDFGRMVATEPTNASGQQPILDAARARWPLGVTVGTGNAAPRGRPAALAMASERPAKGGAQAISS